MVTCAPPPERLPPQAVTMAVLRDKYLQPGEAAAADVLARVARALASVEPAQHRAGWERRFHRHLLAGGIGAGPDHAQSSSQDAADNSTQSATLDATHNATHHATPGMFQRTDGLSGALTSGLPAPHFPGLAVSCGLSHAVPHERPTPRKEAQDVHQGAAGL